MGKGSFNFSRMFTMMDIFGKNIELNVRGDPTYKSRTGAVLTIIAIIILIYYFIRLVWQLLHSTTPKINFLELSKGGLEVEMISAQKLPVISLYYNGADGAGYFWPNETNQYATFEGIFASSSKNDKNKTVYKSKFYDWKPCKKLNNREPYRKFFNIGGEFDTFLKKYGLCLEVPEGETILLKGTKAHEDQMNKFYVKSYPCDPDAVSQCATEREISDITLDFYTIEEYLDLSDRKDPMRWTHDIMQIHLLKSLGTHYFNEIAQKQISDNDEPKHLFNYLRSTKAIPYTRMAQSTECTAKDFDDNNCWPYFVMEYNAGRHTLAYNRNYYSLMDLISDFGGFQESVILTLAFICTFYNDWRLGQYVQAKVSGLNDIRDLVVSKQKRILENAQQDEKVSTKEEKRIKKKLKEQFKEFNEDIDELIEKNSSYVSLVNQLCAVQVMKELLFEPHQIKLLPYVALGSLKKKQASKGNKTLQKQTTEALEKYDSNNLKLADLMLSIDKLKETTDFDEKKDLVSDEFQPDKLENINIVIDQETPQNERVFSTEKQSFKARVDQHFRERLPHYLYDWTDKENETNKLFKENDLLIGDLNIGKGIEGIFKNLENENLKEQEKQENQE